MSQLVIYCLRTLESVHLSGVISLRSEQLWHVVCTIVIQEEEELCTDQFLTKRLILKIFYFRVPVLNNREGRNKNCLNPLCNQRCSIRISDSLQSGEIRDELDCFNLLRMTNIVLHGSLK